MKQATVNTFGALGYSSLVVQWLWTVLAVGLTLFTSDLFRQIFLPDQPVDRQPPSIDISLPGPVESLILIAAVLFTLAITAYAIVAVPRSIGRSGQRITQASAKAAITYARPKSSMSRKRRRRLVERITWSIKLLALALPLALLAIPPSAALGLSHDIVFICGTALAACSLLLFAIQLMLAKLWRIPAKQVW